MTAQERIIRNALDAARVQGASFGEGGKAVVRVFDRGELTQLEMLTMIAVMANGLADLEGA